MLALLITTANAAPPVGFCTAEERPRMACEVRGGKLVSLCERKGALVYRFGKPGAVELELPAAGGVPISVSTEKLGPDKVRHVASAWNDGHRYAVISERTEDQFDLSVVVRKGAGKPLATLTCTQTLAVDFTETAPFAPDPTRPESWIGAWQAGDTSLTLDQRGDQLVISEGMAFWHGSKPGQIHTGEAQGPLTRVAPDHLRYSVDGCVIDLKYSKTGQIAAEDNLRCGGLNVSFLGSYTRLD